MRTPEFVPQLMLENGHVQVQNVPTIALQFGSGIFAV